MPEIQGIRGQQRPFPEWVLRIWSKTTDATQGGRGFATLMAVIFAGAGIFFWFKISVAFQRRRRLKRSQERPDVVILQQYLRPCRGPSLSVDAIGLETFLRMTKIPYETEYTLPFCLDTPCPIITLNGRDVPGKMGVQIIKGTFDLTLKKMKHGARTGVDFLAMAQDRLQWVYLVQAFVHEQQVRHVACTFLPVLAGLWLWAQRVSVTWRAWARGLDTSPGGRVQTEGMEDLRAISNILGKKRFILGPEPSELDCSLFAVLSQFLWNCPKSPYQAAMNKDLSNLKEYCLRMKKKYWPDWDDL